MEKIMGNQLSSYFESNKLFSKPQYGFHPGHSIEYAALDLVDRIITDMMCHSAYSCTFLNHLTL